MTAGLLPASGYGAFWVWICVFVSGESVVVEG